MPKFRLFLGLCLLAAAIAAPQAVMAAKQDNNAIISNDAARKGGEAGYYLNPQLRYQGASESDDSRLRSQRLKQEMRGMLVGDFSGNGKNEIAIMGSHDIAMFVWSGKNARMEEIARQRVSGNNTTFLMRAIDLDRDGTQDIVITTYSEDDSRPTTYFYSFKGGKFREVARRVHQFITVANVPPYYTPTLVGMSYDSIRLFDPGVRLVDKKGDTYALGPKLDLPKEATCFNFTYMPPTRNTPAQLIVLTQDERLKIYQGAKNTLIHTTTERFSGSAVGMDHYKSMPGLGVDKSSQLPSKYYAPMHLITADITRTGEPVLLINKPISTASQFFERYRNFPQGEIHALYWDGVGMALKWKTRRIRGSVAAVELADVNNDGVLDLVVGINTTPEIGIGSSQCMVTAYPLDLSAANPNTPADMSEFEVSPTY